MTMDLSLDEPFYRGAKLSPPLTGIIPKNFFLTELEEKQAKKEKAAEQLLKATKIAKGHEVKGLFRVRAELHGLVYIPSISTWFHAEWNHHGICVTGNCPHPEWSLSL